MTKGHAATTSRSEIKRALILEAAMRAFAESGYQKTRVEDIASSLSIAKGSIFQHFGSKEGLFLAAYKKAVSSFPAYLDAPEDIRKTGFFEILRYWLVKTQHLVREDWIPYRISLLGNYAAELALRREINRFLLEHDPYGTVAFVRLGIDRGEVRKDVDQELIVSMLDWTIERFQDALLTEELDPGLFRRGGRPPEGTQARIDHFLELLRSAIEPRPSGRKRPPALAASRSEPN